MVQLIRSKKNVGILGKGRKVKLGSGGHVVVLPPLEASGEMQPVVTEGLENGLSIRSQYPGSKIFITSGKSNLRHVPRLFNRGDQFIVIADHDDSANPAHSGQFAASELRKSLVAQGVSCQALMPPRPGWDANAALCAGELDEWLLSLVPVPNMSSLLSEHGALTLSPTWGIKRRSEMIFPARSWLIEGLLEARTLSIMAGPPGVGKSFLALDMACCIQSGKPWHGRAVDQGDVLYLGAEGIGLESRLIAWEHLNQIGVVDLLLSECRGQDLADQAESFAALMEELPRVSDNLKLIVIDTLSKLSKADENIASEVGKVFRHVDQLRLLTQAAVLLVHHTGWKSDQQLRGSTAILASVDHHLGVTKSSSTVTLRSEKTRDTPAFNGLNFELVNVEPEGGCMDQVSFGCVAPKLLEGFESSASSRKESRFLQKKSSAKFSEMQKIFIDNFKIISNQNGLDGTVTQEELRENMKRSLKSFSSSNWRDLVNAKTLAKYFKFDSGKVSQIADLP